jgi:quercetin dioxygenase-like cupin family protein
MKPSPIIRRADTVRAEPVQAGEGTTRQVLVGPDEAPNFALRRFVIEPGGGMPRHTNTVEHEQYVLRGRARITIADGSYEVGPADVLFIPAGAPHSYEVLEAPFEFLCVVPNAPDRIEIVDPAC